MDGLERIIQKINEDADATVSAIIADAEKKSAEIIKEAESIGDAEARDIIANAQKERDAMIRKAHSGGELLRKKKILANKVEVIDNTISRAVEKFLCENVTEYFDAMIRLAVKYAPAGEFKMVFSDKDISRAPADFEKKVNAAVGEKTKITVCGGGGFNGGFLLIGDETVENCTIDALIKDADTEIRDELCKLMFV